MSAMEILVAFAAGVSVGFIQGRVFERWAKFKAAKEKRSE